ncbi:MAG: hypothetical protein LBD50_03160 [Rickettsiales bacterium]|jgi:hypothetical protein|nr:hypothetical protein [Rickettsiales bacterium]
MIRIIIISAALFFALRSSWATQLTTCPAGLSKYNESPQSGARLSTIPLAGYTCTQVVLCEESQEPGCYLASDGDTDASGTFEYTSGTYGICPLT